VADPSHACLLPSPAPPFFLCVRCCVASAVLCCCCCFGRRPSVRPLRQDTGETATTHSSSSSSSSSRHTERSGGRDTERKRKAIFDAPSHSFQFPCSSASAAQPASLCHAAVSMAFGVSYQIVGRADCPYFARAERLAQVSDGTASRTLKPIAEPSWDSTLLLVVPRCFFSGSDAQALPVAQ
jgi:hypothetical protein